MHGGVLQCLFSPARAVSKGLNLFVLFVLAKKKKKKGGRGNQMLLYAGEIDHVTFLEPSVRHGNPNVVFYLIGFGLFKGGKRGKRKL